MREIKFRALGQTTNKWYYGIVSLITEFVCNIVSDYEHTWMCDVKTLSQYTGLKDKNGTEIYEGDIVKFGEDEVLYEVYQHDSGSWDARGLSLWEWISENGNENEWEVMGNIYENPGLLEGRVIMQKQKRVTEIIEEVREEMCDEYCKHIDKALRGKDMSELCNKCPLNRL